MKIAPVSIKTLLMPLIRPVATKAPRHELKAADRSAAGLSCGARRLLRLIGSICAPKRCHACVIRSRIGEHVPCAKAAGMALMVQDQVRQRLVILRAADHR